MTVSHAPALTLEPTPSMPLTLLAVIAHAAAGAIALVVAIRYPLVLVALPAVAVSMPMTLRRLRLRGADAPVTVRCRSDGSWEWTRRDGRAHRGVCHPRTVVLPHLVCLQLRAQDGARLTLWLTRDSVGDRLFHRLRMHLRTRDPASGH